MKKLLSYVLCALLALSCCAFAVAEGGYPVTIHTYNYAKEPIDEEFTAAPERVICTNQTQTELMLYFGLADRLVGVAYLDGPIREDLQADYAALVADGKELTVTGYPNKEIVLSLEPDFIFGWRSAFADDALGDVSEWQARGVNTMILRCSNNTCEERNIGAVLQDIADIGAIFGIEEKTDAYIAETNAILDEVTAHVATLDAPLNALIIEPMGEGSWYCWGANCLTGSLIEAAGAVNLSAEGGDLSIEGIIGYSPDVIVVDYMGGQSGDPEEDQAAADAAIASLTSESALAEVPAVANGRIMAVNLTDIYGGGIRMVPSVQAMYGFFYGE